MQELKPCPFCGGKVRRTIGSIMGFVFFKCRECGATISFNNYYYNEHKDEAIEAYNRRVNDED